MASASVKHPVLLTGSVPLACASDVFASVGARLGDAIGSIPDGETGARLRWIGWQREQLMNVKGLELQAQYHIDGPAAQEMKQLKLKEGFPAKDLTVHPLGYAREAIKSYRDFQTARAAGKFAPATRFQVSIPSAAALATGVTGPFSDLLTAFEKGVVAEVGDICAAIPHADLALQWDICLEIMVEEGARHPEAAKPLLKAFSGLWTFEQAVASLARISAAVPAGVKLGAHLCYGDPDGTHIIEPADTSVMVDMANALSRSLGRSLDWIHFPVPIGRDDDAYFAPLKRLKLQPETQIYLGLVHHEDGVAGARRRMMAARKVLTDFGVGTECGLGRIPPDIVPGLLSLHREVAELA